VSHGGSAHSVETIGVFGHSLSIRDSDNDGVVSVVAEEDLDEVASDVTIGSPGDLEGERLVAGVDVERLAECNIEIHDHALTSDTILLVVEPSPSLAAHEGGGKPIAANSGSVDDPIDVRGDDLLVGTQEDHLVFAESVDDGPVESLVSHCEVEDRIHESLNRW
jgi:hypothetical protein